ncbi:hypothetical protein V6N13_018046 [Hibiscus sabdariffa]|uniref:Uncharacterized protein n=1 Tax=Hibiscus sabdariffa TaxID=183260 RepID=A0ABR2CGL9_9ROSI
MDKVTTGGAWSPKLDLCFAGFELSIVGLLWVLSVGRNKRDKGEKESFYISAHSKFHTPLEVSYFSIPRSSFFQVYNPKWSNLKCSSVVLRTKGG